MIILQANRLVHKSTEIEYDLMYNIKKDVGEAMKKKQHRIQSNFKTMIILFFVFVFMGIFYSFGVATFEQIRINQMAANFKARAVFDYEDEDEGRIYYRVERIYDYELNDARNVFYDDAKENPGQKGDIYTTRQSPFPAMTGFHQFMSYYFGGHAAINNGENRYIEALGFPEDGESFWQSVLQRTDEDHELTTYATVSGANYWLKNNYHNVNSIEYPYYGPYYRTEFFGLRVKDITSDEIDIAVDYANDQAGESLYNFLFFLDMKSKFYCVDLVSRAYQSALSPNYRESLYSRDLNDDGFITSVQDIILSKQTYMTLYMEVIDRKMHIYYLEDILQGEV